MKNLILFAQKLKQYRDSSKKSLSEVASVIGVDRTYISKLENAHERPTEAVLNKIIGFYSLSMVEAQELWTLAGYRQGLVSVNSNRKEVIKMNDNQLPNPNASAVKEIQVKVPEDKLVLYSDSVFVTTTQYGLVLDFAQSMGPTNQQTVVSRIGMSKEHAKALLEVLAQKLNEAGNTISKKKGELN